MIVLGVIVIILLMSLLYVPEVIENIKLTSENKTFKQNNKELIKVNRHLMQQLTSKVSLSEFKEELITAYSLNREGNPLDIRKSAELFINENFDL